MTAVDEPRLDHDARCVIWTGAPVELCSCRADDGHVQRTPWAEGPMTIVDTETTGVDTETDRIVTCTVIYLHGNADPQIHTWLLDPGVEIPEAASNIHGYTEDYVAEHGRKDVAAAIAEIEATIAARWSTDVPLLACNASFDLSLLDAELRRHHARRLHIAGPVIDPYVIDKGIDRYRRGSRKLVDLCAHYRVKIEGAHDATADCLAAARVAWRIGRNYPDEVGRVDPRELHAQQTRWYGVQQRSFAKYLRDKVAPKQDDPDERAAVLAKADAAEAQAGGWPLRVIGGGA